MKAPEIIYKYRDWEIPNHKRILQNNELYFASPRDFDDSLDCKVFPEFSNMTNLELDSYIRKCAEFYSIDFKIACLKFKDLYKAQNEYNNIFDLVINEEYGILSLSWNWQNNSLWSNYANMHKGFCIGFVENEVKKINDLSFIGFVNYTNEKTQLKPICISDFEIKKQEVVNQAIKRITIKSVDWIHEDEYRLMKNFYSNKSKLNTRIVKVKNNAISDVTLGINITNNNKKEILNLCEMKGVIVYQSYKDKNKINRRQIL